MNTSRYTTLRWNDLVNPKMIGNDIWVEYCTPAYGPVTDIIQKKVRVSGTAHIDHHRVLLVYDEDADDIFIIMRDGQGYLWDAYQEV